MFYYPCADPSPAQVLPCSTQSQLGSPAAAKAVWLLLCWLTQMRIGGCVAVPDESDTCDAGAMDMSHGPAPAESALTRDPSSVGAYDAETVRPATAMLAGCAGGVKCTVMRTSWGGSRGRSSPCMASLAAKILVGSALMEIGLEDDHPA